MRKPTEKDYEVVIRVRSQTGAKPVVKTIGGDTIFCYLEEGMTATWKTKRVKKEEE